MRSRAGYPEFRPDMASEIRHRLEGLIAELQEALRNGRARVIC
jgi:hypothetical protein